MGNLFGKSYKIKHVKVEKDDDDDEQPRLTMANQGKLKSKFKAADEQNAENRRLNQEALEGGGGHVKDHGDGSSDADLIVEREQLAVRGSS